VRRRRWVRVAQDCGGLTDLELEELLAAERGARLRQELGAAALASLAQTIAEMEAEHARSELVSCYQADQVVLLRFGGSCRRVWRR
jgi:hypothetical protein